MGIFVLFYTTYKFWNRLNINFHTVSVDGAFLLPVTVLFIIEFLLLCLHFHRIFEN